MLQEQKRLELEEMNRVLAELGIASEKPVEHVKEKGSGRRDGSAEAPKLCN